MQRLRDDRPGPGQALARRGIRVAKLGIIKRGASIKVEWMPGHCGVQGNELADGCARDGATRAERLGQARKERGDATRQKQGLISISFVKTWARKRANEKRGRMVAMLNKARGYVTLRRPHDSIPRIPEELQRAPKELASQYFQLASGHAMIAPFLKEKFGWIGPDVCWWCGSGRQTREHLFKECLAWKREIKELWEEIREATDTSKERGRGKTCSKEERVFIWEGRRAGAIPQEDQETLPPRKHSYKSADVR